MTSSASNTPENQLNKQIKRRSFVSFITFFAVGGSAFGIWKWLRGSPLEPNGITAGAQKPLRRALNKTELFFRKFYSNNHLVKTYPKEMAAKNVRVNSHIGIEDTNFKPENWQLALIKGRNDVLKITLNELMALPKTDLVFDFKCVEGWDQIQHWSGVKLIDFMAHYQLHAQAEMQYMGLETPDKAYYVGLDMESALHPQTILAYHMNGKPLTIEHGAPLRLIVPVKYGIKNLKRIGTITFSNQRPPDYWAEQGYDYYSGL